MTILLGLVFGLALTYAINRAARPSIEDQIIRIFPVPSTPPMEMVVTGLKEPALPPTKKKANPPKAKTMMRPPTEDERLLRWGIDRMTPAEIGAAYEEMVAHDLMCDGWSVRYDGIGMGLADRGVDLTARKGNEVLVIQCKCWSRSKTVREDTIRKLYDTVNAMRERAANPKLSFVGVLYTSTVVSIEGKRVAKLLGVRLKARIAFRRDFPRVKVTKDGIYHSPLSSPYYYDIRTPPIAWFRTTKEARDAGFRPTRSGSNGVRVQMTVRSQDK